MTMIRSLVVLVLATAVATSSLAQSMATTNMDILRQKVKADKKLLVAQNLNLTGPEGTAFWPVYEEYQKDLTQINNQMAAAIQAYAEAYNKGPVTDSTAKKLVNQALAVDDAEAKLKTVSVPKFLAVLPATKAARYIQIENKIRAAIRYELAASIPLVE